MLTTTPAPTTLTCRDRAVLRAVDAGRVRLSGRSALVVDGLFLADPFAAARLSGYLSGAADAAVSLTDSGRAALAA
jgi:hypothetical protein